MRSSILHKLLYILQILLVLMFVFIKYARSKALPTYFPITTITDITVISSLIIMIIRCWIINKNKK